MSTTTARDLAPQPNKRRRLSFNSNCLDSSFISISSSSSYPDLIDDNNHDNQRHINSSYSHSTSTPPRSMMVDIFPTTTFPAEVLRTPTRENSTLFRKRRDTWSEGTKQYDEDEDDHMWNDEHEKRQDTECTMRSTDDTTQQQQRTSPRSPIAVLKLRRTNLFPEEDGKPTKPITVTYRPSSSFEGAGEPQLSSRSIASSMLLVSPLRPLARHCVVNAPSRANANIDLKTSLIDSSQTILRPLTPPHYHHHHRPKRSLSDAMLLDDDDDDENETSNLPAIDASLRLRTTPTNPQTPKTATPTSTNDTVSSKQQQQQRWLIPAEHPYKVLWDVLTFMLSLANVYATHTSIRDRQFGNSWFMTFCEAWFIMDILLNFITEYRSDNYALRDCRSVWARYLTTWFVVDVLSLFPGEALYLQPIIEQQNRRNFFKRNFFRSKAVLRVTRMLRGRHFKMFGKAAKHTKYVGVGASRLLRLLIKYIPKYLLFFRNMKGVVALRLLRQMHWFRRVWRNVRGLETNCCTGTDGNNKQNDAPLSLRKFRPIVDDYDEDDDPF